MHGCKSKKFCFKIKEIRNYYLVLFFDSESNIQYLSGFKQPSKFIGVDFHTIRMAGAPLPNVVSHISPYR